jgi:hypothetical protein
VAPLIQALLFGSYVANNSQLQEDVAQIPGVLEPRYFVLLLAPVTGLVSGAVLGTGAWLAAKSLTRRQGVR